MGSLSSFFSSFHSLAAAQILNHLNQELASPSWSHHSQVLHQCNISGEILFETQSESQRHVLIKTGYTTSYQNKMDMHRETLHTYVTTFLLATTYITTLESWSLVFIHAYMDVNFMRADCQILSKSWGWAGKGKPILYRLRLYTQSVICNLWLWVVWYHFISFRDGVTSKPNLLGNICSTHSQLLSASYSLILCIE